MHEAKWEASQLPWFRRGEACLDEAEGLQQVNHVSYALLCNRVSLSRRLNQYDPLL